MIKAALFFLKARKRELGLLVMSLTLFQNQALSVDPKNCEEPLKKVILLSDHRLPQDQSLELYSLSIDLMMPLMIGDKLAIHKNLSEMSLRLNLLGFKNSYHPLQREIEFHPDEKTEIGRWVLAMRQAAKNRKLPKQIFRLLFAPERCRHEESAGFFDSTNQVVALGYDGFSSLLRSSRGLGQVLLFHEISGHFHQYLNAASGRPSRAVGRVFIPEGFKPLQMSRVGRVYREGFSIDEPNAQEVSALKQIDFGNLTGAMESTDRALALNDVLNEVLWIELGRRMMVTPARPNVPRVHAVRGEDESFSDDELLTMLSTIAADQDRLSNLRSALTAASQLLEKVTSETKTWMPTLLASLRPYHEAKKSSQPLTIHEQKLTIYRMMTGDPDSVAETLRPNSAIDEFLKWWQVLVDQSGEQELALLKDSLAKLFAVPRFQVRKIKESTRESVLRPLPVKTRPEAQ